jgi:hypothetical protein
MASIPLNALRSRVALNPRIATLVAQPVAGPAIVAPTPTPVAPPPAPPPPPVAQAVVPTLPVVPTENPFNHLPRPSPGDRIRAEDFRQLSSCLELVHDATLLSAALFGHTLAEARPFIAAQGRSIAGVLSVFGAVLSAENDPSLDQRRVVQVLPVVLGEAGVHVVVTEAVETRRLSPTLMGLNYAAVVDQLRGSLGQGTTPTVRIAAPSLVNLTLSAAANAVASTP